MLIEKRALGENSYALKCSFEGKRYAAALLNYTAYIDELFCDSFEHDLFPEGKTPTPVNEKYNGDELYRYIFQSHFAALYQEAILEANLDNVHLEDIEIEYFSSKRILFTLIVSTNESTSSDNQKIDSLAVLKRVMDQLSAKEKLRIFSDEKRDAFFWQTIQTYCTYYQQQLSEKLVPVFFKIGVLTSHNGGIGVDISAENPLRAIYPLVELAFYPCAVFYAALHEYLPDFSNEDETCMRKYVFSLVDEMIDKYAKACNNKHILQDRLYEYSQACKGELMSGYSLFGQFGMDFDRLKSWSQNHTAKCAHLFCDFIAYIEHMGELGTYQDLDKLKPIVVSNSPQTLKTYMELYDELYTTSCAIFLSVRGLLNGSEKMLWKAEGLCQHCGGEFKKTLFGTKCAKCKVKKDY